MLSKQKKKRKNKKGSRHPLIMPTEGGFKSRSNDNYVLLISLIINVLAMVVATSSWSLPFNRHNADDNIYNHKVAFEGT